MSWQPILSAKSFLDSINLVWPKRDKKSDGVVGDTKHAARLSDHNPDKSAKDGDPTGTVHAVDVDKDLGVTTIKLAPANASILAGRLRMVATTRDTPMKYIIWNGRIASSDKNWVWRKYTGDNRHTHHMHISFDSGKWSNQLFNWVPTILNGRPPIAGTKPELPIPLRPPVVKPPVVIPPITNEPLPVNPDAPAKPYSRYTLVEGMNYKTGVYSEAIKAFQKRARLPETGYYDAACANQCRWFQKTYGEGRIPVTGVCGPETWEIL